MKFYIIILSAFIFVSEVQASPVDFISSDVGTIYAIQETSTGPATYRVELVKENLPSGPASCSELTAKSYWNFVLLDSGSTGVSLVNPEYKRIEQLQMSFCYLLNGSFNKLDCSFDTADLSPSSYGMFLTKSTKELEKYSVDFTTTVLDVPELSQKYSCYVQLKKSRR